MVSLIRLLTPWPAMLVEGEERLLLACDLHLGIEYELAKMGINIPYQTDRIRDELASLLRTHNPDRLLLLGDVKHGVPITSFQEKQEIPKFFNALLDLVENIDVTRGNHDANIQNLLPEGVDLHNSRGFVLGSRFRVGALHGHAWPNPHMMDADMIVMGHNHPTVRLNTPLGIHITRRIWLQGRCEPEMIAKAFLEQTNVKEEGEAVRLFEDLYEVNMRQPKMVIMPAFNDLVGGLPVNADSPKSLLGPLFRANAVNIEEFEAYLLDGAFLGKVDFLRTLTGQDGGVARI